jgi:hypothetical protein
MAADRFWWDAFLGRLRRYRFDDPILAPAVIPRSVVALNLAERNRGDSDVSHYWVSKKPDGVRAVWDGKSLRFLSGNTVPLPPQGFVDALPSLCWIASFGSGAVASAIVRRLSLEHVAWRRVRRRIFELSDAAGSYSERIEQTKAEAGAGSKPFRSSSRPMRSLWNGHWARSFVRAEKVRCFTESMPPTKPAVPAPCSS